MSTEVNIQVRIASNCSRNIYRWNCCLPI